MILSNLQILFVKLNYLDLKKKKKDIIRCVFMILILICLFPKIPSNNS